MKLKLLVFLGFDVFLSFSTLSENEQNGCPHGSVIDETGQYCCPTYCGKCGGHGCHDFPGGEYNCCPRTFLQSCSHCTAPCILTDIDPILDSSLCPPHSVIDVTENYCCPESCGRCGGDGCHHLPGGEYDCCWSTFQNYCEDGVSPCILTDVDPINEQWRCPPESIIDVTGKYCCPKTCGRCGGDGCHLFQGGEFNCCGSTFTESCDDGVSPCVISDPDDVPTETSTEKPTNAVTKKPTNAPTEKPTNAPTEKPTNAPTEKPADEATDAPIEPSNISTDPCPNGGIIASITVSYACDLKVCCPSTCEKCDTNMDCTEPAECCAHRIAEPVTVSDVDISCRNHDPPCVAPPEDDPCSDNPCENEARCGYMWKGFSFSGVSFCFKRLNCECEELGGMYSGEYCELLCDEGSPCGYRSRLFNGGIVYKVNDQCCEAEQSCVNTYPGYDDWSFCGYPNRPSSCDPDPCLNGGVCKNEAYFYYCECLEGYSGGLCENSA